MESSKRGSVPPSYGMKKVSRFSLYAVEMCIEGQSAIHGSNLLGPPRFDGSKRGMGQGGRSGRLASLLIPLSGESDGKTTGSRPFVHSGPPAFCLAVKPGILGICGTPGCFILNSFQVISSIKSELVFQPDCRKTGCLKNVIPLDSRLRSGFRDQLPSA